MINARKEALKCVPIIHNPIRFKKDADKTLVQGLINLGSEVNTIHPSFAKQLGLPIRPTDIKAQKIDGTTLDTYWMVVAAFSVVDKANQVKFFEETFLVANISPEVVLGMFFLTLSGANVDFLGRELRWRTYTTKETFPTTRRVELMGKKKFAAAALDLEHKINVVYIGWVSSDASPNSSLLDVYPFRRPQIFGLIAEEALTKVSAEYLDFADVFSLDLASKLSKHTRIKDHAIELVEG